PGDGEAEGGDGVCAPTELTATKTAAESGASVPPANRMSNPTSGVDVGRDVPRAPGQSAAGNLGSADVRGNHSRQVTPPRIEFRFKRRALTESGVETDLGVPAATVCCVPAGRALPFRLRDEMYALHDASLVRFERLETEYSSIKAGLGRVEHGAGHLTAAIRPPGGGAESEGSTGCGCFASR